MWRPPRPLPPSTTGRAGCAAGADSTVGPTGAERAGEAMGNEGVAIGRRWFERAKFLGSDGGAIGLLGAACGVAIGREGSWAEERGPDRG